jgi:hypothetical protein
MGLNVTYVDFALLTVIALSTSVSAVCLYLLLGVLERRK